MIKRFIKKFKKRVPWLSSFQTLDQLLELIPITRAKKKYTSICLVCRGTKLLCGKTKCPILTKLYNYKSIEATLLRKKVEGSSPPAIFIGRYGYPYVSIGPLVPPTHGDTSIMDTPENWGELRIDDIIKMRFSLVRGKKKVHVKSAVKEERIVNYIHELALAKTPVDSHMILHKEPKGVLIDSTTQPIGPSAPLKDLKIYSIKTNHLLEKFYYDYDLKAFNAVLSLYKSGLNVSSIIRGFSAGLFGLISERKFVPTRWSITAIDSLISQHLINKEIKKYPVIDSYQIYVSEFLGDKFLVIFFPEKWSYEFIEAWFPGTTWNLDKHNIAIGGDWEPYWGRTNYAEIGGCYYAARLAAAEYLSKIKKQAKVLILRESYPEHILPLGVWHVRESVRIALRNKPYIAFSFNEVLQYLSKQLIVSLDTWFKVSRILIDQKTQSKIIYWVK